MIHWLCKEGQMDKANDLLLDMEAKNRVPSEVTFCTLLRGFIQNNKKSKVVVLLHKMAAEKLVVSDLSLYSKVVDLLSKDKKYRECLNQFRHLLF